MTCREALVSMLGADPSELAGQGDSAVAIHVRGCARCAAVAARLMSDTRLVASAVAERDVTARRAPRRVAWRPAGAFAGTLALAAMVLAVMVIRQSGSRVPVSVERTVAPAVVAAPPAPVAQPVKKFSQPPSVHRRPRVHAQVLVAGPKRYEAIPMPAVSIAVATPPATVAVEPSAGKRAAVIRTSNPSVTVVWIY